MDRFATLPEPPYFAVIFTNQRSDGDAGYDAMSDAMAKLATEQIGYIGAESTRDAGGLGITVSYWTDEQAIENWKNVAAHALAQKYGKERWYEHYALRVARVERQYKGPLGR